MPLYPGSGSASGSPEALPTSGRKKSFWEKLRSLSPQAEVGTPLSSSDISDTLASYPSPEEASFGIDVARQTGHVANPFLKGRSKGALAQLDRAAQFANLGRKTPVPLRPLMALPAAAAATGYEMVKQAPLVMRGVSLIPGMEDWRPDETTSPPSAANISAAMKGYMEGAAPGLLDIYRRKR